MTGSTLRGTSYRRRRPATLQGMPYATPTPVGAAAPDALAVALVVAPVVAGAGEVAVDGAAEDATGTGAALTRTLQNVYDHVKMNT